VPKRGCSASNGLQCVPASGWPTFPQRLHRRRRNSMRIA